ncbi:uncharacterized protein BO96DRAFT_439514 [Aspergillus niger CBS 101883]|uniref:uncharacterized protein n=1 Tax=Aspergillus lacticoffeatus (strain CBS 101883) TaxID=1450533 RepID=UPI000D8021A4|nr:uncharacterized protein BO96DRAFT_439514 [Aspergillus niger CBS 101883]PYH50887.1 hypothetical protein BO96DRAFT_439514 [Aspergillus niger CBS 101883]
MALLQYKFPFYPSGTTTSRLTVRSTSSQRRDHHTVGDDNDLAAMIHPKSIFRADRKTVPSLIGMLSSTYYDSYEAANQSTALASRKLQKNLKSLLAGAAVAFGHRGKPGKQALCVTDPCNPPGSLRCDQLVRYGTNIPYCMYQTGNQFHP